MNQISRFVKYSPVLLVQNLTVSPHHLVKYDYTKFVPASYTNKGARLLLFVSSIKLKKNEFRAFYLEELDTLEGNLIFSYGNIM